MQPPFRKRWETPTTKQLENIALSGNQLYYGTWKSYGALDLATGKRLWEQTLAEQHNAADVALHEGTLYVSVGQRGLLACDPATGATRWSVPGNYYGIPPLVIGERVLATLKEGFLSAIHTRTHRILWTTDLRRHVPRRGDADMQGPCVLAPRGADSLLVGTHDAEVFCLDLATGKPRWRWPLPRPDYRGEVSGFALSGTYVFVTQDTHVHALESGTGRPLWRFSLDADDFSRPPLVLGNVVLAVTSMGQLYALDPATGKRRWTQRVSTEGSPLLTPLFADDKTVLVGTESQLLAFDASGKKLWAYPTPDAFWETPLYPLGSGFVAVSAKTLARFEHGTPPPLPTEPRARRALAEALVAKLDTLTGDEQRTLSSLTPEAGMALLPLLSARLDAYLAEPRRAARAFDTVIEQLQTAMHPSLTAPVLELIRKTDPYQGQRDRRHARFALFSLLREKSNLTLALPHFIEELQAKREGSEEALFALSHTANPDALVFLKAQLADPKAQDDLRRVAYLTLARNGGAAFVPAILDQRRPTPTHLTEAQRILLAAFDGRFHFDQEATGTCVVELPKGVTPLPLAGWNGKILFQEPKAPPKGTTFVSLDLPTRDFANAALIDRPKNTCLLWNQGHTEVKLLLRTYVNPMNATGYDVRLKKFGTEWIVLDMNLMWIS